MQGTTEQTEYERYKAHASIELSLSMASSIPEFMNPLVHFGAIHLNRLDAGCVFLDFLVSDIRITNEEGQPFRVDATLTTIEESVTEEMNESLEHVLSKEYLEKALLLEINHELELFGQEQLFENVLEPSKAVLRLYHEGSLEYEKDFRLHTCPYDIEHRTRLYDHIRPHFEPN